MELVWLMDFRSVANPTHNTTITLYENDLLDVRIENKNGSVKNCQTKLVE